MGGVEVRPFRLNPLVEGRVRAGGQQLGQHRGRITHRAGRHRLDQPAKLGHQPLPQRPQYAEGHHRSARDRGREGLQLKWRSAQPAQLLAERRLIQRVPLRRLSRRVGQ